MWKQSKTSTIFIIFAPLLLQTHRKTEIAPSPMPFSSSLPSLTTLMPLFPLCCLSTPPHTASPSLHCCKNGIMNSSGEQQMILAPTILWILLKIKGARPLTLLLWLSRVPDLWHNYCSCFSRTTKLYGLSSMGQITLKKFFIFKKENVLGIRNS